jgi:hypothetical protein
MEWCSSTTSTTLSLGGMARRGLGRMCQDRLARGGGGTIWRRGGVDGKSGERLRFGLTP